MDFGTLTTISCAIEDGIARVVLDNPERGNPIDGTFCREIKALATDLSERPDVRCVLISARGRMFSVGGDIKTFTKDRAALPEIIKTWTADLHSAMVRLMRMRAPVVAQVEGNVAGGAVSFVAAADIVVAAETARFTAAFPAIGFSADSGSTVTLSQRMGFSRAKRFLLLSETISGREAVEAGLVDILAEEGKVADEAEAVAKRFAAGATIALGGIKQTMLRARNQPLESQMEDEAQTLAAVSRSDDSWEGLQAFVEKRKPDFKGR